MSQANQVSPQRTVNDAMKVATQGADRAASSVGEGLHSLAGTVRQNLPRQGMMGTMASSVAEGLDSSGRYLQKEGVSGMVEDLAIVVRKNPLPAVLAGVGLGFFLAKLTSRR